LWSAVASLHRQQSRASAFSVDDVDESSSDLRARFAHFETRRARVHARHVQARVAVFIDRRRLDAPRGVRARV
jgi:hypothetical protein